MNASFSASQPIRIAMADVRGEGRPDFNYVARVLAATTVSPARVASTGGRIVIQGVGFQVGNVVTIGGLLASVQSLTSNEIVAIAPALSSTQTAPYSADVVVTDLKTGGTTKIVGGLTYAGAATDTLQTVSAPSGTVPVGSYAATAFAVRLLDSNGKAVANSAVTFTASAAGVRYDCGSSPCSMMTDATGVARTAVTPLVAGAITLQASTVGGATATASVQGVSVLRALAAVTPTQFIAEGQTFQWTPAVSATMNGAAASSVAIAWTPGSVNVSGVQASTVSNGAGSSANSLSLTLAANEVASLTACAWRTVCTVVAAKGVAAAEWNVQAVAGTTQSISATGSLSAVTVRLVKAQGDPIAAVPVAVNQRVEGWQPACSGSGRCAIAPVYGTSTQALVSAADGSVTFSPAEFASTASFTKVTISAGPAGI